MKKPSAARYLAAVINGRNSRGPKTAAGKLASSRNALHHGLAAGSTLLPGEPPDPFLRHHAAISASLAPRDENEEILALRVSAAAWKLLRADALEAALLEHQAPENVASAWAESRAAQLASLYESRHQREFWHSLEAFYDRTRLWGEPLEDASSKQNQELTNTGDEKTNEPKPQSTTPLGGQAKAAAPV